MPINIPNEPKVYTTKYENFRGVDFTNDATNVWYRRSPDAVNMLPDDSGSPYKRTGWEVKFTIDDLSEIAGISITKILKCFYFELAGIDHIIVFAEGGLFVIYEDSEEERVELLEGSTISECYGNYDRAFFFEGGGRSAFYIYGNSRIWIYEHIGGEFIFHEADDVYVPRVLIGTDPSTCAGTAFEAYNLVGKKAKVEYSTNDMFYCYSSGDYLVSIDKTTFTEEVVEMGIYEYEYDGSSWLHGVVPKTLSELGITVVGGQVKTGDLIVVVYTYGVLLPLNVTQSQLADVKVKVSTNIQFDTELEVKAAIESISINQCRLHTDLASKPEKRRAWIEFSKAYTAPLVAGEDLIQVEFPVTEITITNYDVELEDSATIQGRVTE